MQISINVISSTSLPTLRAITYLIITLSSSYCFFLSFIHVNYCIGYISFQKADNPVCVDVAEDSFTIFLNVFVLGNFTMLNSDG